MKRTGVFYHEICGKEAYKTLLMGVEEGFESLKKAKFFSEPNVIFFEAKPVTEEEIAKIHSQPWIHYVKQSQWWRVSLYSIGGIVGATEEILRGRIDNALAIVGVGGHHARRDSAWGGCYFNDTAIAINYAREKLGAKRFAIIDTDTHHADGTRDLIGADEEILHLCLCSDWLWNYNDAGIKKRETKICFSHGASDEEEIKIIKKEVPHRLEKFRPELIYWIMGLDTHKDSYGTASLSERCYPEIAKVIKEASDKVCDGKLIVRTSCNAPANVTEYIMPRIVNILAEIRSY
jgi:acetoin utilization deacetylase AcuC-like enzyme